MPLSTIFSDIVWFFSEEEESWVPSKINDLPYKKANFTIKLC